MASAAESARNPSSPGSGDRWSHEAGLRAWQRDALTLFEANPTPDFLAVATPGAGKTTFALAAARRALLAQEMRRLVVVVPTQHLKFQWALAAERFGLHLDPAWTAGYGALPSDVHGVVVTYQQVAAGPEAFRPLVRQALVLLDEIHHAGESRSWGDGVRRAFEGAPRRLCLSGTPFRSDQNTIPFVRYEGDLAQADYEYGYGQALHDPRVVRPVYFPRLNGHMEWTAPDGLSYSATFEDPLTRELANQRLRAALDLEGEWLPAVLARAHAQLAHLRKRDPRAGGLVIAMDQEHARGIARILEEAAGEFATVATSDDPGASQKIAQFSQGHAPWLVAVRMVSEGVDIPRLRVGVYATNTMTELFFRQAVGRVVRWSGRSERQSAYVFIPDDARLRHYAGAIAEQRRHCLRKREDDEERPPREPAEQEEPLLDEERPAFQVISAVPLDGPHDAAPIEPEGDEIPDLVGENEDETARADDAPPSPPLVPLPEPEPVAANDVVPASPLARRRHTREQLALITRELVHLTGRTHADVNAELNRAVGIKRVSEATLRQLERRLAAARAWLDNPRGRPRAPSV